MKRDWQLIREILRKLEAKGSYGDSLRPDTIDGYDQEAVSYHMKILGQAGFVIAFNLTWEGHELLDKINSDTVWNKLRGILREKSLDLSCEAIKAAASSIIAGMF